MASASRIALIDLAAEHAELRQEIDAAIAGVLDSGRFILGPEVVSFERELAAVAGAAHAVGVSSGSDALLATLMALDLGPGDEVVTTPFTFFATAGAIARLGARIVFADIEEGSMNLDPAAAEAALGARTRVVLPVNLFGRPATLPQVPPEVTLVEDAAQSLGAAPVRSAAACVSFFPTKNLGALGDAGAVLTDDDALADRLRLLRGHGSRPKYHHIAVGGNFRIDALHAAVLRVKLTVFEDRTAARRARAAEYRRLFSAASVPPELRLPPPADAHVYHHFVVRAPRRDALRAHLAEAGIETEVYYPEPLHLAPCFSGLGYRPGAFPRAERAAAEALAIPVHPFLTPDQQARVVSAIERFYAAG